MEDKFVTHDPIDVLLVDDDRNICRTLSVSLKDLNCRVVEAHSVGEALDRLDGQTFDLILTDYKMKGRNGLDLVREVRSKDPLATVVVMTAYATFGNAVAAVREGAFDYLPKPFTNAQLSQLIDRVALVAKLRKENEELRRGKTRRDYFAGLTSQPSQKLEEFARKIAPTDATVLLVGESGTGKSELARLIHDWSPRSNSKFVTIQCTSLAESLLESELFGHVKGAFTGASTDKKGKLELADHGTLFLDEIGDLPPLGQSKLLRFLQEKVFEKVGGNEEISVDTRIITATNKNLEEAVKEGRFRDDLYYRLNILECTLVPLRFRREDIPVLIQRLLEDIAKTPVKLPDEVMKVLLTYHWPGNVRELRNVLERMIMLSNGRDPSLTDLPGSLLQAPVHYHDSATPLLSLEDVEREYIQRVLAVEHNLEKAAQILGITTVTLWRKRKQYGLN